MQTESQIRSPFDLKLKLASSDFIKTFVKNSRDEILAILNGSDPRILLIVGPCSIHNPQAALEYAKKLACLRDKVKDSFLIVMRTYFEKPRTIYGWKGLIYDPRMDGSFDIEKGLYESRKLLLQLNELQIPTATEFLDPSVHPFISDLISWGCIGARTAESQTHRQLASSLDLPISFKNSTSGSVKPAINGILSSSLPSTFLGLNDQGQVSIVQSKGNPDCHLTLRGSDSSTNYGPESIYKALDQLEKAELPKRLLIDCSHGNSSRKAHQQCTVFQSVIHQIIEVNLNIRGMILESELFSGNQAIPTDLSNLIYGVSVTDPCIDFKTTEKLIEWAFERLQKNETLTKLKSCEN